MSQDPSEAFRTDWHEGERQLQKSAGIADGAGMRRAIHRVIPEAVREFLPQQQLASIAVAEADGAPVASAVLGPAGFVTALDETHLSMATASMDPFAREQIVVGRDVGLLVIEPMQKRRMRANGRVESVTADAAFVVVDEVFGNCPKHIVPRAPQQALSVLPTPGEAAVRTRLVREDREQIRDADTFFLATRHPVAGADASHRGGEPGFVQAPEDDDRRLWIPEFSGNRMFQSLGNLLVDDRVSLAFFDFSAGVQLQIQGRAAVVDDPARVAKFEGAQRLLDVRVEQVRRTAWADYVPWALTA